jgi:hypothetical protein
MAISIRPISEKAVLMEEDRLATGAADPVHHRRAAGIDSCAPQRTHAALVTHDPKRKLAASSIPGWPIAFP